MKFLNKTAYVSGHRCSRHLWALVNDRDLLAKVSAGDQKRRDDGEFIGELALKLYPEGIMIGKPIEISAPEFQERKPLFEAGISHERCYARADILVPVENDMWDIVEVKSSSSVKPHHELDLAFQKYCYEGAGLKIRNCYILHTNRDYVRRGEIDPKGILKYEEVTDLDAKIKEIPEEVKRMLAIIDSPQPPQNSADDFCQDTLKCPTAETLCWPQLPEYSSLELYYGKKEGARHYLEGRTLLSQLPTGYDPFESDEPEKRGNGHKQHIQITAVKENKVHIEKDTIGAFMYGLTYPLTFLDFETLFSVIPYFDGTRPNQQVPYQYSLHGLNQIDEEAYHIGEFLAEGSGDPRRALAENLVRAVPHNGSIITYNAQFEDGVLRDLGEGFPDLKDSLEAMRSRMIDLLIPFREFYYHNPLQHGSNSIKSVAPALGSESYTDLAIGDGISTGLEFLRVEHGSVDPTDRAESRRNQLLYCAKDTLEMVNVLQALNKLIQ